MTAMKWNWSNFNPRIAFAAVALTVSFLTAKGQTPDTAVEAKADIDVTNQDFYERHVLKMHQRWMKAIPNIVSVQHAGNIGFLSAGIGWDYGQYDCWETHLQIAFLPKYHNDRFDITFTIKENLVPWSFGLGPRRWADENVAHPNRRPWNRRAFASIEPLVGSLFVNTIFNNEFWVHEPEKYNGGDYYRFSSKMRINVGIGSRISFNIPKEHRRHFDRISLYYELSTYDLAISSAIPNKKITASDILTLGIGIQYKFW